MLDVKVRSDYVWQERIQRLVVFGVVGLLIALVVFGVYRVGRFGMQRFIYANPTFAISRIDVETDGNLGWKQITQLAGIEAGQNIFSVDLDRAKRDLELNPLIAGANVERQLPNRVRITLHERVPMAQICVQPFGEARRGKLDPIVFYIDKHGVIMAAVQYNTNAKNLKPLPALTGVKLADLRVGKTVQSPQVYAALDLLRELEVSTVGVRLDIERIDLARPDTLALITRTGETISFDPRHVTQGLRRLGVIMADAQRNRFALLTVDLTVQQHVPVTFRPLRTTTN